MESFFNFYPLYLPGYWFLAYNVPIFSIQNYRLEYFFLKFDNLHILVLWDPITWLVRPDKVFLRIRPVYLEID